MEHPSGLHIFQRPDGDSGATFVQTVEENMKMFTKQQVKIASKARELYKMLHDDVKYVPSKGRQSSLLSECDFDGQRCINGSIAN